MLIAIILALFLSVSNQESIASSPGREFVESYLGMKAAVFLFGDEEVEKPRITLPAIPKVTKKNTDQSTYKKDSPIYSQGEEYQNLSNEKKKYFHVAFVQELIRTVRQEEPDDEEVGKWYNSISEGASREGVYRALVLDQIYARRESIQQVPSSKLLDFSVSFAKKYLNKNFKKESLAKVNLYTIKRVITEQCLEVLDELVNRPRDVYRWYAVFSGEMAKNYTNIWSAKIRSNPDVQTHFDWASSVPFQHIKSELILKLHTVMNHLDRQSS